MHIVIAGGSGFLGTALTHALLDEGHEVTILTRQTRPPNAPRSSRFVSWTPNGDTGPWMSAIHGADGVVNLAGESLAARRWSAAQKQKLRDSRLRATRSLAAAIRQSGNAPRMLASGSAVGVYGDREDETLTETSSPGNDFLARLAQDWEAAANEAATITRVALIRTGIVLDRREGALAKMLPPFQMFAGGPFGSGRQYMSWIHLDDWVRLVVWAIRTEAARGPLNATAPRPVTNREFAAALGHVLHRPSLLPAPAFALRLALGEMADSLLLSGQRVLPVRATDLGFSFRFTNVDEALADIIRRKEIPQ